MISGEDFPMKSQPIDPWFEHEVAQPFFFSDSFVEPCGAEPGLTSSIS